MLLYRVHLRGDISIGMYNAEVACDFFETWGRHPTPSSDSRLRTAWSDICDRNRDTGGRPQWWFGFGSLAQFSNWVYHAEWWQKLTDEGYVISMIEVPEDRYHLGYTQAIMHKHHCEIVQSVPVIEWETLRQAVQPRDTRREYYVAMQRYAEQDAICPAQLS